MSTSSVVPFSKNASRSGTSRACEEGKAKELASPSSRSDRIVDTEKHKLKSYKIIRGKMASTSQSAFYSAPPEMIDHVRH